MAALLRRAPLRRLGWSLFRPPWFNKNSKSKVVSRSVAEIFYLHDGFQCSAIKNSTGVVNEHVGAQLALAVFFGGVDGILGGLAEILSGLNEGLGILIGSPHFIKLALHRDELAAKNGKARYPCNCNDGGKRHHPRVGPFHFERREII